MQPSCVIVSRPLFDFDKLIGLSHDMLGYNLSAAVDASRIPHSDAVRALSCLASLRDPKALAGITPNLLTFASYWVLIAADERDLTDILEATGGMPFVLAETIQRGVYEAIVSGSLNQWRDAVKTGASQSAEHNVRALYCKIMHLFEAEGLTDVWKDFASKPLNDRTFYLEDKRK